MGGSTQLPSVLFLIQKSNPPPFGLGRCSNQLSHQTRAGFCWTKGCSLPVSSPLRPVQMYLPGPLSCVPRATSMFTSNQSGSHTVTWGRDLVLKAVLPGIQMRLTLIERPGGPQRGPHCPPRQQQLHLFGNPFHVLSSGSSPGAAFVLPAHVGHQACVESLCPVGPGVADREQP